ncbi:SusC/RagA family TonB-linked outer membrane protein [Cyclobacterium amurskyense]|uniref:TonB-dependent receptor plug n=1 Tax=Cyclobacterium amurskyense TaxID=320787 RepID=A0A0H4PJL2_9BACT|nr:TonB-dependent receptor [Cyclobacterium amurskyense]AKP53123.1 TonB-dependent receptor plug [Cyclobacterium amurskyense]
MTRKLLLFLCLALLLGFGDSFGQSVQVKGTVTDDSDLPIPGVSILAKGTNQGTVTDIDGNYQLTVPSAQSVLVFSFLGFKNQEITVGNQDKIDVKLESDISDLGEVVVVGYGTQKKSDLTGAVATIGGRDLANRRTANVSQALQGQVSGVMVTRNNSAPGSSASIRIRGITTIGDSNPLIIMDGVPVSSIDHINPNDIENISVLKDAASASIYGSRAAAGVILVTTKRAKKGELSLNYNFEFGTEVPTRIPEYVNVTRYMEMVNELRWNDNGNDGNEYPLYPKDMVDNYMDLNASNPDLYPNTDWVGLILKKNAPRQRHSLDISGGTDAIRTKASFVYDKFDALYEGRTFERFTARVNTDGNITDKLGFTADIFLRREILNQPSMDPIYMMNISAPVYAAEWQDGRVAEGKTGANIYGQLKYGGSRQNWENQVGGRLGLNYEIIEGLKISAIASPNFRFDKGKNFQKKVSYTAWDDPTVTLGNLQWANSTYLGESRNDSHQLTTQLLLNYDKVFGKHTLNLLAGNESFQSFNENLSASRDQFLLDNYPYLNLGPLEFRGNGGSAYENAYNSWFGRFSYNYDSKYFLQGNLRYDASSRFARDYRWGSFPSFSAGWVLSEEDFLKTNEAISFLKIRGSYGTLGNERIGNYPYQSTIGFSNVLFHQGSNVVSSQSSAQWQYAIPNISWEKTTSYNIGVDANFLNYRLRVSGEYFNKTTRDMLLPLEIPDYIGFDNPDQNTGKMNTKGWELDLGWADDINELGYSVSFNLSDFRSVMGDLGGIQFLGSQVRKQGSEFDEWYGYVSQGLFQTQEEVDNSPVMNANVRPGDVKYLDISGPNGEPDGKISPEYDRTLLGGSMPRFMYGGNIQLDFRNFDFGLVIQGVGKQNSRLSGLMVEPIVENWGSVPQILDGNYWSTYNTPTENENVGYPRLTRNSQSNNYAMSDFWMINGGYFRLKNISLGYTLPSSMAERLGMQNIRVYGNASDLLTIDNYPQGWDPEVSTTGYPITSSFLMGVSVQF